MDLGIRDKVVLVTGGARGLGRETCFKFAEEGAVVATLDVIEGGAAKTARDIRDGGGKRKWGRIVCLSSIAGVLGSFGQASYAAGKAGLIGLAKCLALEGARFGVTSNVVVPGMISTEMMNTLIEPKKVAARKRIAMGREGHPADIANTVLFLCSERARYITGVVINVTGGMELLVLPD